jgi:hypothetical protein
MPRARRRVAPDRFLHCDWFGNLRALCNSTALDPDLDMSSPECSALPLCSSCLLLATHLRREAHRA